MLLANRMRRTFSKVNRPAPAGDPNTLALLNFDTSITHDDADPGLSWTTVSSSAAGQLVRDTTHVKYGSHSLMEQYVSGMDRDSVVASPSGFEGAGLAAFCIEFWVRGWAEDHGSTNEVLRVADHVNGGSDVTLGITLYAHRFNPVNEFRVNIIVSHIAGEIWNETDISCGTTDANWHHVAFTFDGAAYRLFFDGSLLASQASTLIAQPFDAPAMDHELEIKLSCYSSSKQARIDDFRLSNVARYTSAFTPPGAH
jgi:hypothetical protein